MNPGLGIPANTCHYFSVTPEQIRSLFSASGTEFLLSNRYEPSSLGERNVRRTFYYRRNRREFEELEHRYANLLNPDGDGLETGSASDTPVGTPETGPTESPAGSVPVNGLPELETRELGGLLGRGLFTLTVLKPGDLIGEYTGVVRIARPGRPLTGGGYTSDYAWGFPKVHSLGRSLEIDARKAGGLLRFANHSAEPNAYAEHFAVGNRWRIVFIASDNIPAGGEITVDYGEAYWSGGERELVEEKTGRQKSAGLSRIDGPVH